MSSVIIAGNTSGSITLSAPAISGSSVLTLPVATDTLVGKATTDTLTNKTLTSPTISGTPIMGASVLTSATAQNSTSGTSIDFTGIPSWVKRVTVMFSGVSATGTSALALRIGPVAGVETSGYLGAAGKIGPSTTSAAFTTSFGLVNDTANGTIYHGIATLALLNSATNLWAYSFTGAWSDQAFVLFAGGSKPLAGALSVFRLTTVGGTDTFDAGSINIMYE